MVQRIDDLDYHLTIIRKVIFVYYLFIYVLSKCHCNQIVKTIQIIVDCMILINDRMMCHMFTKCDCSNLENVKLHLLLLRVIAYIPCVPHVIGVEVCWEIALHISN